MAKSDGPDPPPHIIKQRAIETYRQIYGHAILIETGTYRGNMVDVQKRNFKKVYSIELDFDLFKKAVNKFRRDENVVILQGDSGKVLPTLLAEIDEPVIFWLDGHYSGGITAKGDKDCPIIEELNAIFDHQDLGHIILIDDARCFIGENDFPTINEIREIIASRNPKYQVEVKHDIIRCTI